MFRYVTGTKGTGSYRSVGLPGYRASNTEGRAVNFFPDLPVNRQYRTSLDEIG